jgi:hypothetical protein
VCRGAFTAFDDLRAVTMGTSHRDEGYESLLVVRHWKGEAQCDINRSPSPLLEHYRRAYQESLDACPAIVAFFHSVPGLAFLHRLVLALHVVFVEIGACGIRLVCLVLDLTGLKRFVGASYGT